jgi:intracellular sulfur oxidation DsrE/DsrF family protein
MKSSLALLAAVFLASPALAEDHTTSQTEPAAEEAAPVTSDISLPADGEWKHSFDAYKSEAGKPNGAFGRALAFHRLMEKEGIAADRIRTAIVVHGPAVFDVVNDARYGAKYPGEDGEPLRNQNYNDVAELIARGAEIWVCGVAAAYHEVANADLLDGVKMAPSGTVAHAELQRRGYTINPY